MAPSKLFKKITAPKTKKLDDVVNIKTSKELPVFTMPKPQELPPVTNEERALWARNRQLEKNKTLAERIQAMKEDGRLYEMNGIWRRRADEDASERVWLNKKILELFGEGKIVKVDGLWINMS